MIVGNWTQSNGFSQMTLLCAKYQKRGRHVKDLEVIVIFSPDFFASEFNQASMDDVYPKTNRERNQKRTLYTSPFSVMVKVLPALAGAIWYVQEPPKGNVGSAIRVTK